MASPITITVARHTASEVTLDKLSQRALDIFHEVEEACTRFTPSSPLMRANETPTRWHRVPRVLFVALQEAYAAYQRTQGVFDPRVLSDLVALGYDASLRFGSSDLPLVVRDDVETSRELWQPRFRAHKKGVWLGEAVELGGIGKGLAVRWASEVLATQLGEYLVEAGGDCYLAGCAPDGDAWRVGVEDPLGGDLPLAVLSVSDRAVATSSVRIRHWRVGEQPVHHLIDPRTRRSGGDGLAAVTVVGSDPADAEVDAKTLFLAGRENIANAALAQETAALWCDVEGRVNVSPTMRPYLCWERA
ncbi:MAG: FAD:protein FMN transferase [Acidimicrobiaceae bacterium]|nr:FAD:protein FMN transferase [Acidimicrobiaceae bacterium]